jgi:hypothetical protein
VLIPGIDGLRGVWRRSSTASVAGECCSSTATEVEPDLDSLAEAIADLLPDECDVVGQSIGTWLAAEGASVAATRSGVALMSTHAHAHDLALARR